MQLLANGQICRQHRSRTAVEACGRCGHAMCASCVHPQAGGSLCPTCVRLALPPVAVSSTSRRSYLPVVTLLIIAACVALFAYDRSLDSELLDGTGVVRIGPQLFEGIGAVTLFAPSVAIDGEWYRVLTSGFAHDGWLHLVVNMLAVVQLGRVVEGRFGALIFGTVYFSSMIGGAVGAMVIEPEAQMVGASGAIFGILGAIGVMQHLAGRNIFTSALGLVLALNVGFSFLPFVSLGGHLGGLAVGVVSGTILGLARRRGPRALAKAPVLIAMVGFGALVSLVPVMQYASAQLVP